jgi:hypothetical protein
VKGSSAAEHIEDGRRNENAIKKKPLNSLEVMSREKDRLLRQGEGARRGRVSYCLDCFFTLSPALSRQGRGGV